MQFIVLCVLTLLFQEKFNDAYRTISKNARTITNVAFKLERFHEKSLSGTLTAVPSNARRKNKRPRTTNLTEENDFVPFCSPWDSCKNRCRRKPCGLPFTCNCDNLCVFYSDCCADYESECHVTETDIQNRLLSYTNAAPVCEKHPNFQWPIYVIHNCTPQWKNKLKSTAYPLQNAYASIKCGYGFLNECRNNNTPECHDDYFQQCQNELLQDCEKNPNNSVLITDSSNYIYANPSCAVCNGRHSFKELIVDLPGKTHRNKTSKSNYSARMLANPRGCFQAVNKCSLQNVLMNNRSLDLLCERYTGPVISPNALYKNVYCALCNGENPSTLSCPTWLFNPTDFISLENIQHSIIDTFVFKEGILEIHHKRYEGIPAAFSILLNFGLDGRQRMIFSSEDEEELKRNQERCGKDHMWDPFSEICRKLYCSTEFVLVNFRCVKKDNDDVPDVSTEKPSNIVDNDSEFVHLSLSIEIEYLDLLPLYGKEQNLTQIIADSLAKTFQINVERIRNVNINITLGNFTDYNETMKFIDIMEESQPIIFAIDFDLYESSNVSNVTEPTVDTVVSMLASELSVNEIELNIYSVKSKILEMHQTTSVLDPWCSPAEGGVRREYWNSEFTLIFNDNNSSAENMLTEVYINQTGKTYKKGEFVASILYQGYQLKSDSVNISELAVVCDKTPKLNQSCTRIRLMKDEYILRSDGTLKVLNHSNHFSIDSTSFELAENDSVLVCYDPFANKFENNEYYLEFDFSQAVVSLISMCVSVIALFLVLVTYISFPSLRNLPGCNTMNLTFSLLIMQVTFLLGERREVVGFWCKFVAQLLHYEILSSFMWMNVMAYDLYKTFGGTETFNQIRSKKKYIWRYMVYAYGTPMIILIACFLLETYAGHLAIAPHYSLSGSCWISSKQAAVVFFAIPVALIMVANMTLYAMTIRAIKAVKHVLKTDATKKSGKNDVLLYARMAFVTGLTWTLIFVAAYVPCDKLLGQIVIYLFIIANASQGVFIFSVFVCNKRVASLYRSRLRRILCKSKDVRKSSSIAYWISKTITRSISTNTVVSTISNSSAAIPNLSIKIKENFTSENSSVPVSRLNNESP